MNVQQLFEAFGNIDDQYIEEAASDARSRPGPSR